MWLDDFPVGATVEFDFTTRRFSTGAPHQLAGTPAVRVYKGASTTEDDSGITLTVDFDSRTGLNHVTIDLSADGTFYAAGSECRVVITAGTVDSVSVVGEVVAHFSIERANGVLALLKNGTFGLSALETLVDELESRLTATRAGYLDNLSAGAVATQASVDIIDDFLDTEMAAVLAAVDTEVAAILALLDNARGEPGQGTPPVNPDMATKVDYLYKAWRNRQTQTSSEYALYADDAVTKDHEAACSDDGTTFERGEIGTGA